MFRIDDNWGDFDRFSFTFYRRYNNSNLVGTLPTPISNAQGQPGHSGVYRFNWEHAFGVKTTNHFTLGYLDLYEDIVSADTFTKVKMPTVPGVANTTSYLPVFSFGSLTLGEPSGPPGQSQHSSDLCDQRYSQPGGGKPHAGGWPRVALPQGNANRGSIKAARSALGA